VLYFSAVAIFQALVERFTFLDYANGLQDVGYLFGLNNDCLALGLASPSNGSQFVLGKPFANVALSETYFPLFIVGVPCPCCQEQRSDTGYSTFFIRSLSLLGLPRNGRIISGPRTRWWE
jgi:hypothetical protein